MPNGLAIKESSPEKLFGPGEWDELTPRQKIWVTEYIIDWNASRAAKVAGFKNPSYDGHRMLTNVNIARAVEFAISQRVARTLIRADDVLRLWFTQATADPSELISYVVECCRHCHGIENRYQWHEVEFLHACEKYDEERAEAEADGRTFRKKPPDERGGFGFDPNRPPNPSCPHCSGRGVERVAITPTDQLTPQAKSIYAGMKQTKEGIQVLIKDQAKALENVARHLGMFANDAPLALIQNNVGVRTITRRIVRPEPSDDE